jgi:dTDP-4-amino-4,6-dideoxygalactose transaminase
MFFDDAVTARRFATALCAEGVPAGSPYGGLPAYATPSVLEQRTASGKGHPFHCAEHPAPAYAMGMCPETEDLLQRCVRIGVSPAYTDADCDDVIEAVGKVADAVLR